MRPPYWSVYKFDPYSNQIFIPIYLKMRQSEEMFTSSKLILTSSGASFTSSNVKTESLSISSIENS